MTIRNVETLWNTLVRQADPDFDRARRKELSYDFQGGLNGRRFYENPINSGAYGDTRVFLTDNDGHLVLDENGAGIVIE